MGSKIALATIIAGTLDIAWAMILTLAFGRQIGDMLRYVASGPFPPATGMGVAGAALGLMVHYALIAIMAAIFFIMLRGQPRWGRQPYVAGLIYGLATYVAMNWIVVPLRFATPLPPKPLSIATQLFAHLVLVGLTFARVAARDGRESRR